ncbi:MAG: family 10 glycosylhydrolase, partial [Thermoguttaceae bacterium]
MSENGDWTIPLKDILEKNVQFPVDSYNNRLVLRRIGGDELTVIPTCNSLVFSPNELAAFELYPRFITVPFDKTQSLSVAVFRARTEDKIPGLDQEIPITVQNGKFKSHISLQMPPKEGVYDVVFVWEQVKKVESKQKPQIPGFASREKFQKVKLAERVVQCVVINQAKSANQLGQVGQNIQTNPNNSNGQNGITGQSATNIQPAGNVAGDIHDIEMELVSVVDPTDTNWWQAFAKTAPQLLSNSTQSNSGSGAQNESKPERGSFLKPNWSGIRGIARILPSQNANNGAGSSNAANGANNSNNGSSALTGPNNKESLESRIAELWSGQIGTGNVSLLDNIIGSFVQIAPAGKKGVVPWELYPMPLKNVGKPHILEVEYLSNVPQSLGISILEPCGGGNIPVAINGGVDVIEELASETTSARIMRHKIIFWPRTQTPLILISNLKENKPAVYGKIRLFRVTSELPVFSVLDVSDVSDVSDQQIFEQQSSVRQVSAQRVPGQAVTKENRTCLAYFHRPNFAENFGATRTIGELRNSGVTDWVTFYDGAVRLAAYLKMIGYNGAVICAAADGSSIYPSSRVSPTPKFDNGIFLLEGEDPIRKDILEMVARIFDQKQLDLVPAIDFNSPIPQLEELERKLMTSDLENGKPFRDANEIGLRWVDPDGKTILQVRGTKQGRAPHYNLLHPAVQNAILNQVRELAIRYRAHPSFQGVAIQLSPDGFAQLPEEYWGMDDVTIAGFQRETQTPLPNENGSGRFAVRFDYIRANCLDRWIQWRAKKTSEFYAKMGQVIADAKPGAKLYLTGATMLDGARTQNMFYPTLARKNSVSQHLLILGFDSTYFSNGVVTSNTISNNEQIPTSQYGSNNASESHSESNVIFLRPEQTAISGNIGELAVQLEMEQSDIKAAFYRNVRAAGAIFYNNNPEVNADMLEQISPLPNTRSRLEFQLAPSDVQNRRRFARQLALADCQVFIDGGNYLTLGQEDAITDMLAAYRALP